jgi:tetratricopeptide (TPR) repeat protein
MVCNWKEFVRFDGIEGYSIFITFVVIRTMMKSFLCFLFCISAALAVAQKPAQYLAMAEEASANSEWTLAYAYLEIVHEMDSSYEVIAKYAEAARMVKNYKLAQQLYAELYSRDEGKILPDGLFWLALMEKQLGNYEDAQRDFKKYLKRHKSKGSKPLVARAEQEVKSCLWALDYKLQPDSISKFAPAELINSGDAETSPWYYDYKLYYSSAKNTDWKIEAFNVTLSKKEGIQISGYANLAVSADGSTFYATQVKDGFSVIVSSSSASMSNPQVVLDMSKNGKNCTMTSPGKWQGKEGIFFSSNMEEGEGGYDIWWLPKDQNGWGMMKNCGKAINTPGDELSPFYHKGWLYFSSDWHSGFGGYDVFKVDFSKSNAAKPTNMGSTINSGANDYFFFINDSLGQGWLTSNREGGKTSEDFTTCCNDIYNFRFPSSQKQGNDVNEKMPVDSLVENIRIELPVRLYFHNDEPNPRTRDTTTTVSYSEAYESYLKREKDYIQENCKDLKGEERENAETKVIDFFELLVKKGMTDLEKVCDQVQVALDSGYSLKLNVRGFASPRAESDYNLNLTKRRTMSLLNFMMETRNGYFKSFLDGTDTRGRKLEFVMLPFGEFQADKRVSDDLVNQRQSIYSRGACLERKIEIESVELIPLNNTEKYSLSEDTIDFGSVKITETKLLRDIEIKNLGNTLLAIDSVVAECGCTEPTLDEYNILPQKSATLHIGFNPFGPKGRPQEKKVFVYFKNGEVKEITLRVVLE